MPSPMEFRDSLAIKRGQVLDQVRLQNIKISLQKEAHRQWYEFKLDFNFERKSVGQKLTRPDANRTLDQLKEVLLPTTLYSAYGSPYDSRVEKLRIDKLGDDSLRIMGVGKAVRNREKQTIRQKQKEGEAKGGRKEIDESLLEGMVVKEGHFKSSKCKYCKETLLPGQKIAKPENDKKRGGWSHADCVAADRAEGKGAQEEEKPKKRGRPTKKLGEKEEEENLKKRMKQEGVEKEGKATATRKAPGGKKQKKEAEVEGKETNESETESEEEVKPEAVGKKRGRPKKQEVKEKEALKPVAGAPRARGGGKKAATEEEKETKEKPKAKGRKEKEVPLTRAKQQASKKAEEAGETMRRGEAKKGAPQKEKTKEGAAAPEVGKKRGRPTKAMMQKQEKEKEEETVMKPPQVEEVKKEGKRRPANKKGVSKAASI